MLFVSIKYQVPSTKYYLHQPEGDRAGQPIAAHFPIIASVAFLPVEVHVRWVRVSLASEHDLVLDLGMLKKTMKTRLYDVSHLLLVDGTLRLVHHLNPCVDVRRPWGEKIALRFPPSDRMSNMSRIMRICCAVERGFYFTSNSAG